MYLVTPYIHDNYSFLSFMHPRGVDQFFGMEGGGARERKISNFSAQSGNITFGAPQN